MKYQNIDKGPSGVLTWDPFKWNRCCACIESFYVCFMKTKKACEAWTTTERSPQLSHLLIKYHKIDKGRSGVLTWDPFMAAIRRKQWLYSCEINCIWPQQ